MSINQCSRSLGVQICEIVGLDPNKVKNVELRCDPMEGDFLLVEEIVTVGEAEALTTALKKYRLVELEPAEPKQFDGGAV